jgi:hypothetical protein
MSALGQKQTCAAQLRDVRYGPKADVCSATKGCPLWANSGHLDLTLFESGLAHAVEKLSHRTRRIGNVLLAPRDGDVGHQFPKVL